MEEVHNCIICGEKSNNKPLCYKCWKEKDKIKEQITHLKTIYDAKEYYYNLKNSIFWLNIYKYATEACIKLYAIAEITDKFKNIKQTEVAIKDIQYLLTKKREYLQIEEKQIEDKTKVEDDQNINEIADYRRINPAIIHCNDGHYVRSSNEKTIDDTLYKHRIWHEYEKRYKALDGINYYPDFYLPDYNTFIEYFGVEKNKEKNDHKKDIFSKDKKYNFIFIESKYQGILDEKIEDIIEELKNKFDKDQ